MGDLYNIAVTILGDLPSEFHFIYYMFVVVMALVLVYCVFSPFIIAYKLIKGD